MGLPERASIRLNAKPTPLSRPEIPLGSPVRRQIDDVACPRCLTCAQTGINVQDTAFYSGNVGQKGFWRLNMTPRYTDNDNFIPFKFSRFSMAKGHTPKSATKGLALAIACVLGIALPHAASAEYLHGMDVNEVNANVFEVIPTGAESGLAYWCAAAAYAEQELGGEASADLYIARGEGPGETADRDRAVQFTLDPEAAGITPADLSADENTFNVGGHMNLGNARDSCG